MKKIKNTVRSNIFADPTPSPPSKQPTAHSPQISESPSARRITIRTPKTTIRQKTADSIPSLLYNSRIRKQKRKVTFRHLQKIEGK